MESLGCVIERGVFGEGWGVGVGLQQDGDDWEALDLPLLVGHEELMLL